MFSNSLIPLFLQYLQSTLCLENQRGNTGADLGVHFVGGGLAGMTAASATYPLDLVRTRLAAQVIELGTCICRCLCFDEDFICCIASILFYIEFILFSYPQFQLFFSTLQRNTIYYRGIWHAFHTICREEGFFGLYKGLGATLLVYRLFCFNY